MTTDFDALLGTSNYVIVLWEKSAGDLGLSRGLAG